MKGYAFRHHNGKMVMKISVPKPWEAVALHHQYHRVLGDERRKSKPSLVVNEIELENQSVMNGLGKRVLPVVLAN